MAGARTVSATEALKAARAAGVRIEVNGDGLSLEASAPPPPVVIDLLSRHKAEIVALLRPTQSFREGRQYLQPIRSGKLTRTCYRSARISSLSTGGAKRSTTGGRS